MQDNIPKHMKLALPRRPKTKLYLDFKSSLTRFINQMIMEMEGYELSNKIEFIDLDAHADLGEMPEKDCVTLSGVAATFDEKFISGQFNIGVATWDDKEKVRHDKIISYLTGKVIPMETIPLVSSDDGALIGTLVVNEDTDVSPFAKSNVRSIQYVLVTVLSTETVSS